MNASPSSLRRHRAPCSPRCRAAQRLQPAPAGRRRVADQPVRRRRAAGAGRQQRRDLPGRRSYRPLFEDHRARLVGDTLTVQIVEKVSASQKSTSSIDKTGKLDASDHRAAAASAPNSFNRASAAGTSSNTFAGKGTHREQQRLHRHDHRDRDRRAAQRPPAGRRREADRRQPQRRRAALLRPGRPARDPARQHRRLGADRQRAHRAARPRRSRPKRRE